MFVLRTILILLVLAAAPLRAASTAGIPLPVATAAMAHEAMPDCCQDGSHRAPTCQMQADLRAPPIPVMPDRVTRALHAPLRADRRAGRLPAPALPPPRLS